MESLTHADVAALFGRSDVDDFLRDLGCGDITTVDVAKKVLELGRVEEPLKEISAELKPLEAPQKPALTADGVAVQGIGNMLSYLARCCNAMPPDEILGFVTRGRGVAIHRRDCPNVSRLDPDRVILVSWGSKAPRISRTKIRIQAYDRAGLLNEITGIFKEENINLLDASAVTARKDNKALITATLEVRDVEQLSRVLSRISRLPNVQEVRRQKG
jgi:GTP pyrophosphokinase